MLIAACCNRGLDGGRVRQSKFFFSSTFKAQNLTASRGRSAMHRPNTLGKTRYANEEALDEQVRGDGRLQPECSGRLNVFFLGLLPLRRLRSRRKRLRRARRFAQNSQYFAGR